jgi:CHAT domain-containing protein/tetratricopeptide (TPR) repeat protein
MRRARQVLALTAVVLLVGTGGRATADDEGEKRVMALLESAEAHQQAGRLKAAIRAHEQAVEEGKRVFGASSPSVAGLLNGLALRYQAAGLHDKARSTFLRSLEMNERTLGKDDPAVGASLYNLAELYRVTGEHRKARPHYERAITIWEAKLGRSHLHVGLALNSLAVVLSAAGEREKAIPPLRRALTIFEASQGAEHPNVLAALTNLGVLHARLGQHGKAKPLLLRALKAGEKVLGKDHLHLAHTLAGLAEVYQAEKETARAEALHRRCLAIREAKLGEEHPELVAVLNALGDICQGRNELDRAEPLFRRALAIARAHFGKGHPEVTTTLGNLAALCRVSYRHAEAEKLYQELLDTKVARSGADHLEVSTALHNLAWVCEERGQRGRAAALYERSLRIVEKHLGKDHPKVATTAHNLGMLYVKMGRYDGAEELLRRSLVIQEAKLGKHHLNVATTLSYLAHFYADVGQDARAEALYRRVLAIEEAKRGKDHPDLVTALSNLAEACKGVGKQAEAERLYRRALKILEAKHGKSNGLWVAMQLRLAGLHEARGDLARAEEIYRAGLAFFEAALGKDDPTMVALVLGNLSRLDEKAGRHARAELGWRRVLRIYETGLGKDHPNALVVLHALAGLAARRDDHREAARLFDRARRGDRARAVRTLAALPEQEQASFLDGTGARNRVQGALSLALAFKDDSLAAQSASWLLNSKALVQESLARSALLGTDTRKGDPQAIRRAGRLVAVRQELARLTFARPEPGREKLRRARQDELTAQEQALARQLRQAGSRSAMPGWADLDEVRKALPAGSVLIDLARLSVADFKGKPGQKEPEPRYLAWVTGRVGPVRVVDLGPAADIEAAVRAVTAGLAGASGRIRAKGEEGAEKELRRHLDEVSRLVLKPLLPHVGKAKQWLLSPDGNLWLLPFEALTLPDGSYAIERHQVSYLTSGRDLLRGAAGVKSQPPLVLADPDYDLAPATKSAPPRPPEGEAPTRALPGALRLGEVRRLPGTAAEAKAIMPSLTAFAGVAPRVRTGAEATEGAVKAARGPRVLVLATHGFFLPDPKTSVEGKQGRDREEPLKKWESPLLRCGLLLAGCNRASAATSDDDGVLTGLEVLAADLRGCELVVLSACETGLGEVQSGEGVAGLRQAFQLAGAEAVVSTLWQVHDRSSARLMALFFESLGKGMGKAEALRAAKLKLIEERRDDHAVAHPFFWAAFTLTGQ